MDHSLGKATNRVQQRKLGMARRLTSAELKLMYGNHWLSYSGIGHEQGVRNKEPRTTRVPLLNGFPFEPFP